MKKKFLKVFLGLSLLVFFGFVPRVLAQDSLGPLETLRDNISSPTKNSWQWIFGEGNNVTGEVDENGVLPAIEHAFLGQIAGVPDEDGITHGGVYNMVGGTIASIYANPVASGVYYAYDTLNSLGVAPAYAQQGAGFSGLQPILPIWKAFRNISYSLFAIVFIVTGLMIMFRVKISPQAVLTIESALPKMIGVLILITFSYAIAGFMIDLMYVVIALMVGILGANGVTATVFGLDATAKGIIDGGFWSILPAMGIGHGGFTFLGAAIGGMISSFGGVIPVLSLGGGALGSAVGAVLFALLWFIIALFLIIKLLIALIKTYISVIMAVIFSPFQILSGALPGSEGGFGSWFKTLAANLLVFPAVAGVLIIGSYIIQQVAQPEMDMWYPPLMGPPTSGVFSWVPSGMTATIFVKSILGIGFLFILPSIPEIVKGAFGIKDSGIAGMAKQALTPVKAVGSIGAGMGVAVAESKGGLGAAGDAIARRSPRFSSWWNDPTKGAGRQSAAKTVSKTGSESLVKKLFG